jgi:hypothetical protein
MNENKLEFYHSPKDAASFLSKFTFRYNFFNIAEHFNQSFKRSFVIS